MYDSCAIVPPWGSVCLHPREEQHHTAANSLQPAQGGGRRRVFGTIIWFGESVGLDREHADRPLNDLILMSDTGSAEIAQRPRLNLKPRDPNAAAKLELQRTASGKVRGSK